MIGTVLHFSHSLSVSINKIICTVSLAFKMIRNSEKKNCSVIPYMHTNTVFFHHLNGGQNFLSSIVHCVSCLLNFTFEFVLSNKSTVTVNINAKVLHLLYRTDQKLTLVVIVFSILKSTQILWPHIMAVSSLLFISSLISFLVGRTTPSSEVISGKEKNVC